MIEHSEAIAIESDDSDHPPNNELGATFLSSGAEATYYSRVVLDAVDYLEYSSQEDIRYLF